MSNTAFHISIDSRLSEVPLIGQTVRSACVLMKLDETDTYQLELCAVEWANNVVRHAYHEKEGNPVEVDVVVNDRTIRIEIADAGTPMDTEVAHKDATEFDPLQLDSIPESGFGLTLIYDIMDDVEYQQEDGRNVMKMSKRFQKAG